MLLFPFAHLIISIAEALISIFHTICPSPHLMMNQMHFYLLAQILLWQEEGPTIGCENLFR